MQGHADSALDTSLKEFSKDYFHLSVNYIFIPA